MLWAPARRGGFPFHQEKHTRPHMGTMRGARTAAASLLLCSAPNHIQEEPVGAATTERHVYWHRELPPARAEVVEEDSLEATSDRVTGLLRDRDQLWDRCLADLKQQTEQRLEQEIG